MEVTGTNKSVYFDAETFRKAEELMKQTDTTTLSQLIRDLVAKRFDELKTAKVQRAKN